MSTTTINIQKSHCPHCGLSLDKILPISIGNYARAKGWTEDLVKQAAETSGLNIYAGPTTHEIDPDQWIGLWSKEEPHRDLGPFWHEAKKLRGG